jgi:hypothetical protein
VTFAKLLALAFLLCSMCSTLNPWKQVSILHTKARYFSSIGSRAMHSFSICSVTTLESVQSTEVCTPMALNFWRPNSIASYSYAMLFVHLLVSLVN